MTSAIKKSDVRETNHELASDWLVWDDIWTRLCLRLKKEKDPGG